MVTFFQATLVVVVIAVVSLLGSFIHVKHSSHRHKELRFLAKRLRWEFNEAPDRDFDDRSVESALFLAHHELSKNHAWAG